MREQNIPRTPSASQFRNWESLQILPAQPSQSSPTRRRARPLSLLTREKTEAGRGAGKSGKLANWFDGQSEPIRIGLIPSRKKEGTESFDSTTSTSATRPSGSLHRNEMTSKPAMAGRFSFFSSKSSLAKAVALPPGLNDELLKLNVSTIFKPLDSNEQVFPRSLQDLQQQIEALLIRLQSAYKERTIALKDATAEKEALAEETECAKTRSKHLQMQLNEMTTKLEEQDEAMMNLVDELAQQKLARREAEEARKRSVKLVEQETPPPSATGRMSIISEAGFDSEDDSSADSVFSKLDGTHSPTTSMSSVSTMSSSGGPHFAEVQRITPMPPAAKLRMPSSQTSSKSIHARGKPLRQSCAIHCEGLRASEAWSVVSILKEENQGLKQRVGELEDALDGCIDLVAKLGG